MAKVIAQEKGYFGGQIREMGDTFNVPDALWNDEKRRPRWAVPAAFSGKGDHDGDGKVGGSVPAKPAGDVVVPADWRNGSAAERKALAKEISGSAVPNAAAADEIIEAHVAANAPAPFSDAPPAETVEPIRASNEINDALSTTQPDWVMPSSPVAVED
jgi:hypothetical protein